MPYVIFRNMSPHFDSHANGGIPSISDKIDLQLLQLLHLLPHLNYNDVGIWMEPRGRDLQMLARAIMNRTGRSFVSSPIHSTTQRLIHLAEIPLQQERHQFGITAATAIKILCKTDPPLTNRRDGVQTAPSIDSLGYHVRVNPDTTVWIHGDT